jgi:tRNA dimethylallyltransferase
MGGPAADPLDGAVALVGPTAANKTPLAVALAEALNAEIIGVDSRQIYRGVAVGTAQPTGEEQRRVPHHLIGFLDPRERFAAAAYARLARQAAEEIQARGHRVLLVGGTGLYLRAVLEGLFEGPPADPELRRSLEQEAEREGRAALHARLAGVDPATAARLSPNDLVRVIRALEVHAQTGTPMSVHHARHERRAPTVVLLGLAPPRAELYRRIEERTARMYAGGLLEEARWLLREGLQESPPARSLGFRDALAHLQGELSLPDAEAGTIRDTRRYAKRQLTWFRALPGVSWLDWPATLEQALTLEKTGRTPLGGP